MFERVVVGVDGRHSGREALRLAGSLCRAGGTVTAVHVYAPPPLRPRTINAELTVRARARELVAGEVALTGVAARTRIVTDAHPARGLQRIAGALRADVVVVGPAHRSGPRRALAGGDTVRAVLKGSDRPVAVAAGHHREMAGRPVIGAGFDGRPASLAAVRFARDAAAALGGRVRVVSAAEPPLAFSGGIGYGADWVAMSEEHRRAAEERMAELLDELGAGAIGEVVAGVAREELRLASRAMDLLVVGSRGFGPVRRTLLGSTSSHLVHAAECPVVVVPRPIALPGAVSARQRAGVPA